MSFFGFIAVIIWLFWDVFTAPSGRMITGYDISHYYYFMKAFLRDFMLHGNIPWWNPYAFSGMPFLANPQQASVFYPPTWLFFIMDLPQAFSLYIPLHLVLAMAGAYVLTFMITKDTAASWISGFTYGLSGYFMTRMHVGHVDMIAASSILPWTVSSVFLSLRTGYTKHIIVSSLLLMIELFAGYPTVALFTAGFLSVIALFQAIYSRTLTPLSRIIVIFIIAGGLSAVQLIPNMRFMRSSTRTIPVSYQWAATGSVVPEQLKEFVWPVDLKNGFIPTPDYPERGVYMGRVILILALTAFGMSFIRNRHRLFIWIFAFVGLGAVITAMGEYAPVNIFRFLWEQIPYYKQLRYPPRHLVLYVLSVSFLGGVGLSLVKNRILKCMLIFFIILELVPYSKGYITTQKVPEYLHNKELVAFLQSAGYYRIMPFVRQLYPPDQFVANTPSMYGIFSAGGSESGMMRNYYEFMDAVSGITLPEFIAYETDSIVRYGNYHSPYFDFLNIRYILTYEGGEQIDTSDGKYRDVWNAGTPRFTVYENTKVLPRFTIVPQAEFFANRSEAVQRVASGLHDPRKSVLLVGIPNSQPSSECTVAGTGKARIDEYGINRIALSADMACDGYLVSSEVYYPEWQVYTDGKPGRILEGNLAFRTLFLKKGKHNIVFTYVPVSFYLGSIISLFTILTISLVLVRRKLKYNSPKLNI